MTGLLSRQSNDATMDWTWYFLPFYRLNYKLIEKKQKTLIRSLEKMIAAIQ